MTCGGCEARSTWSGNKNTASWHVHETTYSREGYTAHVAIVGAAVAIEAGIIATCPLLEGKALLR
jgi:hypothetical protein